MALSEFRRLFKRHIHHGTRQSDLELAAPIEPYAFSAEAYLAHFPDAAASGVDPWLHFLDDGFQTGFRPPAAQPTTGPVPPKARLATPMRAPTRDRFKSLRAPIATGAKILEVGPLFTPVAPKRDGYDTIVVDKLSKAELIAQYGHHTQIDTSGIEEVDYLWGDGDLADSIPTSHHMTFDAIIISHVIEHFPNPIGALRSFQKLLKPGGVLSLAVPDKRSGFDILRPITTTGAWIAAFRHKPSVHDPITLFDFDANVVAHQGLVSWNGQSSLPIEDITFNGKSLEYAYATLVASSEANASAYRDCHAWVFTPASFTLIVNECHALGLIALVPESITSSADNEFFVHLRLAARRPITHHERLHLHALSAQEQAYGYKKIKPAGSGWRERLGKVLAGA